MPVKVLILSGFVIVSCWLSTMAQAQTPGQLAIPASVTQADDSGSPEKFVASFYKAWLEAFDEPQPPGKLSRDDYLSQQFLSARLAHRLNDEWYASDENGEPVGPDSDYFTRSQDIFDDWPGNISTIKVMQPGSKNLYRTVLSLGKACNKTYFLVTSIKENGGFKIDSVQYLGPFNKDCHHGELSTQVQQQREFSSVYCQTLDKGALEKNQVVEGKGILRGKERIAIYEAPNEKCAAVGAISPALPLTDMYYFDGFYYIAYQPDKPDAEYMQYGWLAAREVQAITHDNFSYAKDEPYPDPETLAITKRVLKHIAEHHLLDMDNRCVSWLEEKQQLATRVTVSLDNSQIGCQDENYPQQPLLFALTLDKYSEEASITFAGESETTFPLLTRNEAVEKYINGGGRAYFSASPRADTELNDQFLVPDDKVLSLHSENGFDYIQYVDREFCTHAGWIKSDRLVEITLRDNERYFDGEPLIAADLMPLYKAAFWLQTDNTADDIYIWAHSQNIEMTATSRSDPELALYTFPGGQALLEKPDEFMTRRLSYSGVKQPERGYLSTVTFDGLQMRTLRGVGIGDEGQAIIDHYGVGYIKLGDECMGYNWFDRMLMFCLDESSRVRNISYFNHMTPEQLRLMKTPLHD
ncbi:DUF3828 domain-containing protein [Atlantibacter sp.]|uniref:DUF3828 domain-containing protein n=1 Tax=Atlantibacter sp. TaxID=1903473 RepID=UPI0028AB75A7|nr:DUF3828 domain-containing protein [Atlantibacter sp.]